MMRTTTTTSMTSDPKPLTGTGEHSGHRAAVLLAEARNEIPHADQKASILLAGLGIGTGVLLGSLLRSEASPGDIGSLQFAFWCGGVLSGAASVAAAIAAVWPRSSRRPPRGIVTYWAHAAAFGSIDELRHHLDSHEAEEADRSIAQLWHVSRVLARKYQLIRVALSSTGVSLALFLASDLAALGR